jgi:hypothetical protein
MGILYKKIPRPEIQKIIDDGENAKHQCLQLEVKVSGLQNTIDKKDRDISDLKHSLALANEGNRKTALGYTGNVYGASLNPEKTVEAAKLFADFLGPTTW